MEYASKRQNNCLIASRSFHGYFKDFALKVNYAVTNAEYLRLEIIVLISFYVAKCWSIFLTPYSVLEKCIEFLWGERYGCNNNSDEVYCNGIYRS